MMLCTFPIDFLIPKYDSPFRNSHGVVSEGLDSKIIIKFINQGAWSLKIKMCLLKGNFHKISRLYFKRHLKFVDLARSVRT